MIGFDHVSFSYRAPAAADGAGVEDVSLSVGSGEVVVLCGRSGCGKSTLLRLAGGLAPRFFPGKLLGSALLDGEAVDGLTTWEIARRAGSLFQNPRTQFFNVDTTGEVAFALESAGRPEEDIRARVEATFEELGLRSLAGRNIFQLSGGERQKVAFASIWAMHPTNLLLDEPTSNLDLPSTADMAEFVKHAKESGCAVLIAEHRLSWLTGIADSYVFLENGRLRSVMTAGEFAALEAEEVSRMGLRVRDPDEIIPRAAAAREVSTVRDAAPNPLLAARGLTLDRGGVPVLREVDLDLFAGEVCALIGSNGAGKTTLCRTLCGFEPKARGTVTIGDATATRKKRTRVSSMVFQDVNYQLFAENVAAEVTFGLPRLQAGAVDTDTVLRELALGDVSDRHPATLSGGQKQRLAVAACVAAGKRILVFDEPTSGIDLDGMHRVARLLRRLADQGRAVLVITHDLELIACACDRILHMDGGRITEQARVADEFDAIREMMGS